MKLFNFYLNVMLANSIMCNYIKIILIIFILKYNTLLFIFIFLKFVYKSKYLNKKFRIKNYYKHTDVVAC